MLHYNESFGVQVGVTFDDLEVIVSRLLKEWLCRINEKKIKIHLRNLLGQWMSLLARKHLSTAASLTVIDFTLCSRNNRNHFGMTLVKWNSWSYSHFFNSSTPSAYNPLSRRCSQASVRVAYSLADRSRQMIGLSSKLRRFQPPQPSCRDDTQLHLLLQERISQTVSPIATIHLCHVD